MTDDVHPADAAGTNSKAEWLERIEEIGEEAGYFEPLGAKHHAFFVDGGTVLLVTFESLATIRSIDEGQMPRGHHIAARHGWSHLCLIADGATWYRDPAVYRYFDRLVDDAFFEDFDHVVFYGAGMGAYAACAFSVAAPGSTVLALQPVATLDPALAGWDERFRDHRRLNFTDRYGYGPDMIDGASRAFMVFDPRVGEDAMHAALYHRRHVTALRCPMLGTEIAPAFGRMKILDPLIEAACEDRLTPHLFATLLRARRNDAHYLRGLLNRLDQAERPVLAAVLCRDVLARRGNAPRFRKRLTNLEQELADRGIALPAPLETTGA